MAPARSAIKMSKLRKTFSRCSIPAARTSSSKLVERYLETGTPVGSRDLARMLSVGLSPGLGAQRHGRPRGPRADRGAAHLGRPRCRRSRGCGSSSTPCSRWAPSTSASGRRSPSRSTGQRRAGQGRGPADRGQPAALRPQPRRRRGDRAEIGPGAQAHRIRPARRRAGHGGAGGRRTARWRTACVPLPPGLTAERADPGAQLPGAMSPSGGRWARRGWRCRASAPSSVAELDELTRKLVEAGLATLGNSSAASPPTVIVRGRANLINDTMASEELSRIRQLFDELESARRADRAARRRRAGAGGEDLHRLGEQAVLALGLVGDPLALQGCQREGDRRARRDRARRGSTMRASCRWSTIPPTSSPR